MRASRTYGSVRGARDETRVPTATGWMAPSSSECGIPAEKREQSMSEITLIGLDLAMNRKEDYQRMAAAV